MTPEGPYESSAVESGRPSIARDAGDFLELFEFLQAESEAVLGLTAAKRELRIIIHLVRNHLAGRLVTRPTARRCGQSPTCSSAA
jgi:multiple sugar transport system substrate-binding protein